MSAARDFLAYWQNSHLHSSTSNGEFSHDNVSLPSTKKRKVGNFQENEEASPQLHSSILKYRRNLPSMEDCLLIGQCILIEDKRPRCEESVPEQYWDIIELIPSLLVPRSQYQEILGRISASKMSLLDLSLIFILLANVGSLASSAHPLWQLEVIRLPIQHRKHAQLGAELLSLHLGQQDIFNEIKIDDVTLLMLLQVQLLISTYLFTQSKYLNASKYAEDAMRTAKEVKLFESIDLSSIPSLEVTIRQRISDEMHTVRWILIRTRNYINVPSEIIWESSGNGWRNTPYSKDYIQKRSMAADLCFKIKVFVHHTPSPTTEDLLEYSEKALEFDKDIIALQRKCHKEWSPVKLTESTLTEQSVVFSATRGIVIQSLTLGMRHRLMKKFLSIPGAIPALRQIALQNARGVLKLMPEINLILRSPWITDFVKKRMGNHLDSALHAFQLALEHLDIVSPKGVEFQRGIEMNKIEIAWLIHNFHSIFTSLTSTGLAGSSSYQCAKMLKMVRVPKSINLNLTSQLIAMESNNDTTFEKPNQIIPSSLSSPTLQSTIQSPQSTSSVDKDGDTISSLEEQIFSQMMAMAMDLDDTVSNVGF